MDKEIEQDILALVAGQTLATRRLLRLLVTKGIITEAERNEFIMDLAGRMRNLPGPRKYPLSDTMADWLEAVVSGKAEGQGQTGL